MNKRPIIIALTLFFVLFFPLNSGFANASGDMFHSLFWRIPAIILVLLLLDGNRPSVAAFRPHRDSAALGLAFPALCLLGVGTSFLAEKTGFSAPPLIRPHGIAAWTAVVFACLTTGYLEEAYFRVYLPAQCGFLGKAPGFWFPILLFSFCHIYEGPWGFGNAFLAAVILSLIYKKTLSLHGIAVAHGLYNIAAYALMP